MRKKKKTISNFDRISNDYFKEISKFSPLSKEEEISLWEKYKKEDDISARDKIVKSNLKFVASVAKSYIGMGLSYPDLIGEGTLGLMKAMEKFKYEKGYKTISYAVWWIKQSILEALNKRNLLKGDDSDFNKVVDSDAYGSDDAEYNDEVDEKYIDFSEMPELKTAEEIKAVASLVDCLNKRERDVINDYFGFNGEDALTLEEIGKKFSLTKERIRQIKEGALKKLRTEALKNSITSEIYR